MLLCHIFNFTITSYYIKFHTCSSFEYVGIYLARLRVELLLLCWECLQIIGLFLPVNSFEMWYVHRYPVFKWEKLACMYILLWGRRILVKWEKLSFTVLPVQTVCLLAWIDKLVGFTFCWIFWQTVERRLSPKYNWPKWKIWFLFSSIQTYNFSLLNLTSEARMDFQVRQRKNYSKLVNENRNAILLTKVV